MNYLIYMYQFERIVAQVGEEQFFKQHCREK